MRRPPPDDEVADAVRALLGEEPAVATKVAPVKTDCEDEVDDADFERAVQEFIGDDEPVRDEAASESGAPLSRFQRRPSDVGIYAIRGLPSRPGPGEIPTAGENQFEPSGQAAAPPGGSESALLSASEPRTRSRCARARYLASF